jgi:hypothetical protein
MANGKGHSNGDTPASSITLAGIAQDAATARVIGI